MESQITHQRRGVVNKVVTLVAPLLLAASALAIVPAGASSLLVTFSVSSVDFGSLTVGTTLQSQAVVTNTTTGTLYLKTAYIHGGQLNQFAESATGCAGAIAAGASCDVAVTFAPNSIGLKNTALAVELGTKGSGGSFTALATVQAELTGTGLAPSFSLSNAGAGNVVLGSIGTTQSVLTNNSSVPLIVKSWNLQNVLHNSFTLTSGTCPTPVAPGQSCDFVFAFAPKVQGSSTATFSVHMSVVGSTSLEEITQQASVSGTGTTSGSPSSPVSLSSLSFGSVEVGTSVNGSVAVTNTSAGTVKFTGAFIAGRFPHDYKIVSNTCAATLASGASCNITVSFTPAIPQLRNATLAVQTYVTSGTTHHTVNTVTSLSGTGLRPTISVVAPNLGPVTIGSSASAQATLTNTSLVSLHYAGSTLAGPHLPSWKITSTTCRGDLAPSASCQVNLTFAPHTQGDLSTVLDELFYIHTAHHMVAVRGQANVAGQGAEPSFSLSSPSFTTVAKNTPSVSAAVITNTSNVALVFKTSQIFGSNPADFHVASTTCAAQILPNATCNVNVVFKPLQNGSATRTALLKVFLRIAGVSPESDVSNTVALSGQES